ncbi:MAG: Formyltetrahydrofolate deformylase, partial [uncultured Ramlibacter sp.]
DARLHPDPLLRRSAGHRACRFRLPARTRRQHRGGGAIQRPGYGPLLHAGAVRVRPGQFRGPETAVAVVRRPLWHDLEAPCEARADAHRDPGEQGRPLPERPAVSLEERAAASGDRRHRLQPPRLLPARRQLQRAVPPRAGDRRHQGAGGGAPVRGDRVGEGGTGGAGALHADPVGGAVPQAGRARHQHPPQLPAELQGRQAVLPGARPRREADRRHRALRHRRPGRGPDHRAGRGAGGPQQDRGRPDRHGPRHREPGAGPRREVAQRAPGAAERAQDGDLPL